MFSVRERLREDSPGSRFTARTVRKEQPESGTLLDDDTLVDRSEDESTVMTCFCAAEVNAVGAAHVQLAEQKRRHFNL